MRSMGFYANCDEAIHNKVKKYMDKAYTKCVKSFDEIPPLMCSMGLYSSGDEAIQKKVKDYIDKTYSDWTDDQLLELMKLDLESDKTMNEVIEGFQRIPIPKNVFRS